MSAHARLSASSSDRWLSCTRSPEFEEQFPESESSVFAQEGQFAHAVAEQGIAKFLGQQPQPLPVELLHFDTSALREHVSVYVRFCKELIEEARREDPDAVILLEHKVDFSRWVPQGFGTCDLIVVINSTVYVVDLKFGRGLRVEAQDNSQLRLYGLGALEMFDHLFDIQRVVMVIVQPRLGHFSQEGLTKEELHLWADTQVAPAAKLAWHGRGNFVPGDHCRWCRGKAVCASRAQHNLELARFDFAEPETLDENAVAQVLERAARLHAWVKDVETHALSEALKGRKFNGYKLVAGRSNRKFADCEEVAKILLQAGLGASDVYAPLELNNLTALEVAVGKKKFTEILGDLIVKAPGKPTLVPVEDKRPEFTPAASATVDFFNLDMEVKQYVYAHTE